VVLFRAELDRFADAMINIRKEIDECPEILKHAPYNAEYLMKDEWTHPFTRQQAAYPLEFVRLRGKYWPPVRRISNPYGDKNLICSCPDISSFVK
jgi:glycine dehydrogenase